MRIPLAVLALMPAVFLLAMIQLSAFTVPYWDHCELARFLLKYYAGDLHLADFWSGHNHTRPFTYRLVMIGNAILTDWDIRSEYIYLLGSIYAAFLVRAAFLWSLLRRVNNTVFWLALAGLSIMSFSPVGSDNHTWSMMCQLTFADFFITFALIWIVNNPRKWSSIIIAAVMCWLATFTISNGLVAFFVAAIVTQIVHDQPLRFNRVTLFWLVNVAVVLFLYVPGLPETTANTPRPTITAIVEFTLIYAGSALWSLMYWNAEFRRMFAEILGLLLLAVTARTLYRNRKEILAGESAPLILLAFALYTVGSGILTGIGRAAWGGVGPAYALESRYSIYSAYLIYGWIYFLAVRLPPKLASPRWRRAFVTIVSLMLLAGTRTYVRSVKKVYRPARDHNRQLMDVFAKEEITDAEAMAVYPDPGFVRNMRTELKRLAIGPYRMYGFDAAKSKIKP